MYTFQNVLDFGLGLDEDEFNLLIEHNRNRLSIFDSPTYIIMVPVESHASKLAAFPNSYFSCDLNPFENYALTQHLATNYHYKLLGIGAAYIMFIKTKPLDELQVVALATDICSIYHNIEKQMHLPI